MDRKLILDFDRKEKSRKHKSAASSSSKHHHRDQSTSHQHHKHKRAKQEPEEQNEATNLYRDRAKERREGINKDFELDPDDLVISNPIADGAQSLDEDERRRQQIEDSKYLGGDVEHTHLVKGLDFALLEKVKASAKLESESRQQLDPLDRGLMFDAIDSDDEEFQKEALLATSASTSNKRQIVDLQKIRASEIVPCRTALARRILNAVDERWPEKSEIFLPGRMSYIVPIDEESDADVTTILRSKAEQQQQQDAERSDEKELAFDQLINIFAKIRQKK